MKKQLLFILFLIPFVVSSQIINPIIIDSITTHQEELISEEGVFPEKKIEKQKSVRPLRLGLKVGSPNIATLNLEYLTPLADNRISVTADYMGFSKSFAEGLVRFSSFEIGTNIYFNNKGRGFYGSLSYSSLSTIIGYKDYKFPQDIVLDGEADFKFSTFNTKIGVKLGRTVFFRAEVGYAFGKIPQSIMVESIEFHFSDFDEIPKIPGVSSSGLLLFNIGFGVAFL